MAEWKIQIQINPTVPCTVGHFPNSNHVLYHPVIKHGNGKSWKIPYTSRFLAGKSSLDSSSRALGSAFDSDPVSHCLDTADLGPNKAQSDDQFSPAMARKLPFNLESFNVVLSLSMDNLPRSMWPDMAWLKQKKLANIWCPTSLDLLHPKPDPDQLLRWISPAIDDQNIMSRLEYVTTHVPIYIYMCVMNGHIHTYIYIYIDTHIPKQKYVWLSSLITSLYMITTHLSHCLSI